MGELSKERGKRDVRLVEDCGMHLCTIVGRDLGGGIIREEEFVLLKSCTCVLMT